MRLRASIVVVAGAFLTFALGFGWHFFQSAQKTEASLAVLDERRAQLDMSIRQARERIAARQRDAVALQNRIKSAKLPKVAAAKSLQSNDEATLMASDPKLRALYLKGFRAIMSVRNAWLYESLGLTQGQIDRFEDMATAHEDDFISMKAAAIAQGFAPFDSDVGAIAEGLVQSDPGVAVLEQQSKDQFYAAVASEVSEALSQSLANLDRISPVQDTVVFDSYLLAPLGTPHLTDSQEAQLGQILANSSVSYQNGGNADINTIDWDKAYDQAAALLSGAQLQGFKTSMEFWQYKNSLNHFEAQQNAGSQ